jgi:hypothetical protein
MEDEAWKWLKEHDPYYVDGNPDKVSKGEYPYLTFPQIKRRRRREIPFSSLYPSQFYKLQSLGLIEENYVKKLRN